MTKIRVSKKFGFYSVQVMIRGVKHYAEGKTEKMAISRLLRKLEKRIRQAEEEIPVMDNIADRLSKRLWV